MTCFRPEYRTEFRTVQRVVRRVGRHAQQTPLRAATEAAADILADRRVFVLDEDEWQVFDQALSRPAADVPGLRELLSVPTVLDQPAAEPPPAQTER